MAKEYKKICLNCQQDWEKCKGIDCQSWDGACCDDFNCKDMKFKAFWYVLRKI
ncbi:hypothetical protein MHC_06016 [Mycoplasma haemocanis str. Illinois]|uniref:Uncharacterized protein n=1 Tax=Mycoplasma haemocanis (strain Illinois) TaxID=1111676 RepID=I6QQZ2_MYCHN|nr:hypothetical protein MHC_06016 [Mycoplasma haemocanis str. Illinois]